MGWEDEWKREREKRKERERKTIRKRMKGAGTRSILNLQQDDNERRRARWRSGRESNKKKGLMLKLTQELLLL